MFRILMTGIFLILGYYIYENHSPFQTRVTDPYFLEIRISFEDSSVKFVGFGKMNSLADCEARGMLVWKETFKTLGTVSKKSKCKKEIPKKYQKLFANKQISASYLAFDRGNDRERDGRFVIYGVPSSYVVKECSKIIGKAKENYQGTIKCIQGSVG